MCRSCERNPVNPSGGWLSYQPLWKNWITWDRLGWCYYSQLFLESHWKVIFQTANQIKWTSDELQVPWQTLTLLRMVPSSLMDFLIWNASPVNGDIWYLGLPLYVFVASENALFLNQVGATVLASAFFWCLLFFRSWWSVYSAFIMSQYHHLEISSGNLTLRYWITE